MQPASASGSDDERHDSPSSTQVFETTNAAAGNAIQVFDQASDGTLTVGPVVPTGGLGTGDSLASQGGIARDGRTLLVVNGGDNTVSSFVITRTRPQSPRRRAVRWCPPRQRDAQRRCRLRAQRRQ